MEQKKMRNSNGKLIAHGRRLLDALLWPLEKLFTWGIKESEGKLIAHRHSKDRLKPEGEYVLKDDYVLKMLHDFEEAEKIGGKLFGLPVKMVDADTFARSTNPQSPVPNPHCDPLWDDFHKTECEGCQIVDRILKHADKIRIAFATGDMMDIHHCPMCGRKI